jgi:hypothetical protein
VLLTGDEALQEDELLTTRALDARVFKYPRELDALLDYLDASTSGRRAA